jgi:hypothetical protein
MKKLLYPIEKVILQKSRNKKNIESALQEWRFSDQHDFRHLTNSNRKTKCACNHGHPWYFYYCYNIYTNETIQLGQTCYNLLRNIKDKYIKNKTSIKKNKKKLNISTIMNLDDKSILYNLIINQYNLYERIDKIIMDNDFKKHIMHDIKNNNKYIVHKSKLKQFILYSNFYATNIQRAFNKYKEKIKQNLINKTTIIQNCFKQYHIKKLKKILIIQNCFKQNKTKIIALKKEQEKQKIIYREKQRQLEKQKKKYQEQQRHLEKQEIMNRKKMIRKNIKACIKNIPQQEFIGKQTIIALRKYHPYLINLDEVIELVKTNPFYKPCSCKKCRECYVIDAIYEDINNKNIDSNDYSNIVNTVNTYFEQI